MAQSYLRRYLHECWSIAYERRRSGSGMISLALTYVVPLLMLCGGLTVAYTVADYPIMLSAMLVASLGFEWLLISVLIIAPYRAWKAKTIALDGQNIERVSPSHDS